MRDGLELSFSGCRLYGWAVVELAESADGVEFGERRGRGMVGLRGRERPL